ncbi:hypothetical protein ACP4OV_025042 [Aristida adscensionis]
MRLGKRGGSGGGDPSCAALLDAVGLGGFAQLNLRDPPEGLELTAAYDLALCRIAVSLGGDGASAAASPADLAAALALPPAAAGLAAGADAALFCSEEAIAAVMGFVRDRVLLGGGEDGGAAPEEVAAALRLVEAGKAYEVDWGLLVWAVLKGEVLAGAPRLYAPYLLRLMEYQRPELFADLDGRLPKRLKGQQCQWASKKLVIGEEHEKLEEEQKQEGEEENGFVYGLSIGDLEEMSIFGEGKEVTFDVPSDCKRALIRGDGQLSTIDEQDGSSASQHFTSGTKTQPGPSPYLIVEIGNEDDCNHNVDAGPISAATRNVPWDITPYLGQQLRSMEGVCNSQALPLNDWRQQNLANSQTLLPFNDCLQGILVNVHQMGNRYSDLEKVCRDTKAEVQCMKQMLIEKERIIQSTKNDIMDELRVRSNKLFQLDQERMVMYRAVQQYRELLKKCSTEFQEYRNMTLREEGVGSYVDVLDTTEQNALMQKHIHRIYKILVSNFSKLGEKITHLVTNIADLNHEVKRLKDTKLIPDLNNGMEDDGGGETSKTVDKVQAGGDYVSRTTLGGKQLDELTANPDGRSDNEKPMGMSGAQGSFSEAEAYQRGEASESTS